MSYVTCHVSCFTCHVSYVTLIFFNRPGVAESVLQTASLQINSVTHSSIVEISLWRRHALMASDGAFSHKIDYVTLFYDILNREWHQNRINGIRVTVILLNGWILLIGGASAAEGMLSTGLLCLVFLFLLFYL